MGIQPKLRLHSNIEPQWISKGHTNKEYANCEERGFKGHELLKYQKEAFERPFVLTKPFPENIRQKNLLIT